MTERAIAEIFHARLHARNKDLQFPVVPLSPTEFQAANTDLLNTIAKQMVADHQLGHWHIQSLVQGIRNYLQAEGALR